VKSKTHQFQFTAICAALIFSAAIHSARADEAAATITNTPAATTTNAAAPPATPSKDWSVTISQDYYSLYVFRGVSVLKDNPIWVPSVVATYKNLTAYYYGYFGSGTDVVSKNKWYEEDDFAADLHQGLFNDRVTVTAGVYGYLYPDGLSGKDTYEVYGKIAYANYFNPYVALTWDVHAIHGGYGIAGISHAYDVTKYVGLKDGQSLTITPSASLGIDFGYNSKQTVSNVNWNDVLLGIAMTYNVTSALNVHVGYQGSIALNSVRQAGTGNESIVNAGLTYAF
jgi:hypothetical protein